jgi:hypothetical protein
MGDKLFAGRVGARWLGKGRFFTEPVGMPRSELIDAALELGLDVVMVVSLEDAHRMPKTGPVKMVPGLMVQFAELPPVPAEGAS